MSLPADRAGPWSMLQNAIERVLNALDDLSVEELNSRPLEKTNSLYLLAIHTIGQAEENVVEFIGGTTVGRDRDAEFEAVTDDVAAMAAARERWDEARARIQEALESTPEEEWRRMRAHPRRGIEMDGLGILSLAMSHASEHAGHADLTRQWLLEQRAN